MEYFFVYTVRVILVYIFTYFCTRTLTKKAMAQMTAYEIAGIMILANVAAEPLVDKIVIKSVYGSGLIILLMLVTSRLSIINKLTPILEHTPLIIIKNGKLCTENLKYMGLSLNQLEGLIRQQGYDSMLDIDIAIMEPQGNLSIFPKGENKPVRLKDLNIKPPKKEFTIPIIMDGDIIYSNIKHINRNEEWLIKELKRQGIKSYKEEIALAELTFQGKLNIIKK